MNHRQIVAVAGRHGAGSWWQQMVTVTYERARGHRKLHETPGGYSVSVSRVIAAPIKGAFDAWNDPKLRKRWLNESNITIRKATANKSLRMTWSDAKSSVVANFYPRSAGKCQVVAEHSRLPSDRAASKMKAFWSEALDRLKAMLQP